MNKAPALQGVWGEAVERTRRLVRRQEVKAQESQDRLDDILAALQASPNGVVLLDKEGRIEWCNAVAAAHFGFDARRDELQSIRNLVRDPEFSAYYAAQDFSADVVLEGRGGTPSRPVRISVQLHPYGDGRSLLLLRQCVARNPHAVDRADGLRGDLADAAARGSGACAVS